MYLGIVSDFNPETGIGHIFPREGKDLIFFHFGSGHLFTHDGDTPTWNRSLGHPRRMNTPSRSGKVVYDLQRSSLGDMKAEPWGHYSSYQAAEDLIMFNRVPATVRIMWASIREFSTNGSNYQLGNSEMARQMGDACTQLIIAGVSPQFISNYLESRVLLKLLPYEVFDAIRIERPIKSLRHKCTYQVRNIAHPSPNDSDYCCNAASTAVQDPTTSTFHLRCTMHEGRISPQGGSGKVINNMIVTLRG